MPVMDEFKEERDAIKNGTFKDKLKYFWYYYKFHTIGAIALILISVSLIKDIAFKPEEMLYMAFINFYEKEQAETDFRPALLDYIGADESKQSVILSTSIRIDWNGVSEDSFYGMQQMAALIMAGQLDVLTASEEVFVNYAYQDNFLPLNNYLSEEELEKYADRFYYIDADLAYEFTHETGSLIEDYIPRFPKNPNDPSSMNNPVPVALIISDCERLNDNYYCLDDDDTIITGIVATSEHVETAAESIRFLLGEEKSAETP